MKADGLNASHQGRITSGMASLVVSRVEARGGQIAGGPELRKVVALLKDRSRTLNELADASLLFYREPTFDSTLFAQHLSV